MPYNVFDIIVIYILFLFGLQFIFLTKAFKDSKSIRILKKIGAFFILFSCTCFILGITHSYISAVKEDNLSLKDFISLESKDSIDTQLDSLFKSSDPEIIFSINNMFRKAKRIENKDINKNLRREDIIF